MQLYMLYTLHFAHSNVEIKSIRDNVGFKNLRYGASDRVWTLTKQETQIFYSNCLQIVV